MTPWIFTCMLPSNDSLKESVERLSNTNSSLLLLATIQRAAGNVTNGEIYNVPYRNHLQIFSESYFIKKVTVQQLAQYNVYKINV